MKEKYYITTAIAYTSGKPHIGNTYEIILGDAIARYQRFCGKEVYFQTGTDEHGEKIELKAKDNNESPQDFVDKIATQVQDIWDLMDVDYDKFVRTTDSLHKKVVQNIFKKLYDQGDIYKGEYTGLYCVPCESFWTETQLVDGKCPDCGRDVNESKEEAYFFKLSKYQSRLEQHIADYPEFIQPDSRKNEMINNFLKPGLQDLCVSRTSFKWGVPVSFDDKHVVYVWLDALTNYISFIGYDVDTNSALFNKLWPCDLHLVGKDIIRFHTLYWPIFLMALDLPLPKQIFGHPWLLAGDDKMSKSKGNVMYADDLAQLFGVDAVRYFVLAETPFANDGNITYELLIDRINSNLANVLGNLVNRTMAMGYKYFNGNINNTKVFLDYDKDFINSINNLNCIVAEKMNKLEVSQAITEVFKVLSKANKYIDDTTPWILAKENKLDELESVLYNLLEAIRVCSLHLEFAMPSTSAKILEQINNSNNKVIYDDSNNYNLGTSEILFNRIDKEKFLKDICK